MSEFSDNLPLRNNRRELNISNSRLNIKKRDLPKRTDPFTYYIRVIFTPQQQPARRQGVRWAHGTESKMRSSCRS